MTTYTSNYTGSLIDSAVESALVLHSYSGDVNDLTQPGLYIVWGGSNNIPNVGAGCFLWVFGTSGGAADSSKFNIQVCFDYISKTLRVRYKWNSSTWSSWSNPL